MTHETASAPKSREYAATLEHACIFVPVAFETLESNLRIRRFGVRASLYKCIHRQPFDQQVVGPQFQTNIHTTYKSSVVLYLSP